MDERTGEVHRYGQRRGVYVAEILLPALAHSRLRDRQTLWNEVERAEARSDAQLARELNVALPHELSRDEQHALLRNYVSAEFVKRGMIADIAIHVPRPGRGEDERNVHAHVMLTLRQGTPLGLHAVKTREWNSRDLLKHWRLAWAEHANRALALAGHQTRIDARSLAEQRNQALANGDETQARSLSREPELHMGPNAIEMARKQANDEAQLLRRLQRTIVPPLPYKVADNAGRIERNTWRAWDRYADAQAEHARLAARYLTRPSLVVVHKDGTSLSYADMMARYGRPPATGPVAKAVERMRDTEIREQAVKVWRRTGHQLDDSDSMLTSLLMDAQMRPVAKSPFQVTAKDIAFSFYRMGLMSLERLSTTLERIEAEQALQRASARQDSFWSRVLPRSVRRGVTQARAAHRRRRRASDPNDP